MTLNDAITLLNNLEQDPDINKRVKEKSSQILTLLQSNSPLCVQKALFALEELNSQDLSSYHRTQIWDIVSLLESLPQE